jgi:hypothetical protein
MCFAQFSDGVYAALQGNGTQQLIYFYDSELNYLGYKNIHGKICDYNGVQKTIDFIYLLIPYNGQFIATLQTTDGTGYICRSNDGGESWTAYSIIDTIIERGFVDGGLILLLGTNIFYSIDNGSLFNEVTNSRMSVRTGSPFIIQTDFFEDIIIPVESNTGYFQIDRIRQTNIAKGIIGYNFTEVSGYIVLANGLKIQWVRYTPNFSTGSRYVEISLPTMFSNNNFFVQRTNNLSSTAESQPDYDSGYTNNTSYPATNNTFYAHVPWNYRWVDFLSIGY